MHTHWLMLTSAAVMGLFGLALSFMPQETLALAHERASAPLVLLAQIAGAMAVAWAVLDWMCRRQRIGGIYNRPLALANFLHFAMGSLTLLRLLPSGELGPLLYALLVPYAALAIWWMLALFTSPV